MSDISRPAVGRPVQTSVAPAASQQDPATANRTLAQSATDPQLPRKTSFYHIGDSTEVNETITAPQGDSFEELDMNEQDVAVEAYLDAAEVPTAPPASYRDDGSPVVPVGCKACAGQLFPRHFRWFCARFFSFFRLNGVVFQSGGQSGEVRLQRRNP